MKESAQDCKFLGFIASCPQLQHNVVIVLSRQQQSPAGLVGIGGAVVLLKRGVTCEGTKSLNGWQSLQPLGEPAELISGKKSRKQ